MLVKKVVAIFEQYLDYNLFILVYMKRKDTKFIELRCYESERNQQKTSKFVHAWRLI